MILSAIPSLLAAEALIWLAVGDHSAGTGDIRVLADSYSELLDRVVLEYSPEH